MFLKSSSILLLTVLLVLSIFALKSTTKKSHEIINHKEFSINEENTVKKRAKHLKAFIESNEYSEEYCFIINMAIPSGKPRFTVYNLQKDSIEKRGLVTHGVGSETKKSDLQFKNIPGSLATSIGKYKVGKSYYGQFGLAYKLHGLDATNSKAFERFVVLHSHDCVPEEAVFPQPICVSWGCPTVAPAFLVQLQKIIDNATKPILLDIIYEK